MNNKEYVELAIKTDHPNYQEPVNRIDKPMARLLHGAVGLVTESAEVLDAFKKHIFYGRVLDYVNIKEELGDVLWYIAIMCNEMDIDMESIMQVNIDKLKKRYGDKFSNEKAIDRDVKTERQLLDDGFKESYLKQVTED